jgi:hypothetical protein
VDENTAKKRLKKITDKVESICHRYHLHDKIWLIEKNGKFYTIEKSEIRPFYFKLSDEPIDKKLIKKFSKGSYLEDCYRGDVTPEYLEKIKTSKVLIVQPGRSWNPFECKECGRVTLRQQPHQKICPSCYLKKLDSKKPRYCKCGCGRIIPASAHRKKEFYFNSCRVNHWRKTHKKS